MSVSDEKLGEKARELVVALSDFTSLILVKAPTPVLVAQVDTLNQSIKQVLAMCPNEWSHDSTDWTDAIMQNQGRLIELFVAMQSRSSE